MFAMAVNVPQKQMNMTFGPLIVSLTVSSVLYGVTLLQSYLYYRRYQGDSIARKMIVALLLLLDTVHVILCTITMYWYLVQSFGDPDALNRSHWSMNIQTDFNGLIALIVQCIFAHRVWTLSKNMFLGGLIVILSLLHFVLGVVFTAEAFILGHFSKYSKLTWVTCLGLGAAFTADTIIAVAMCYYLAKRRNEFERTNSIITTLIIYSVNTGLVTSLIALAAVIAFASSPTTFVWLSFFWLSGKCYINSLLAMFNSRDYIREKAKSSVLELSSLSNPQSPSRGTHKIMQGLGTRSFTEPVSVNVETAVETKIDHHEFSKSFKSHYDTIPETPQERATAF